MRGEGRHEVFAFLNDHAAPCPHLLLRVQGGTRGDLGEGVDAERRADRPQPGDHLRVPQPVADADPGQPVGFGEGPQHDEVRMLAQQLVGADGVVHVHKVDVRLVEQHGHALGDLCEECRQIGVFEGDAGRVVGAAQQKRAGALGDGGEQARKIVRSVGVERHLDGCSPGSLNGDRIRLEGAPGKHDLAARRHNRLKDLLDERGRPVAHDDAVVDPLVKPRNVVDQPGGEHVRIPVEIADGG